MEYAKSGIDDLYAKLSIDEEDEGGIIVEDAVTEQDKDSFVLIGRFLTERNINFKAMQNVLSTVWRPKEGVEIYDIGEMRYSFVFYHPMDVQKVVDGGPWAFEQGMLVYKQLARGEDPKEIPLNEVEIWIQIYDIPKGLVSENILKGIANYIGEYVKTDPTNLNGLWTTYYRIRVRIDVCKPLKSRMKIKREGGDWSWINFKYDRLSTFCFVCGKIGHSERDCNVVYANPGKELARSYGTWLRAPNKNTKTDMASRWLRNGEGARNWGGNGENSNTPATENETEKTEAEFTENGKLVVTSIEGNKKVTATTKNQEPNDKGGKELNVIDLHGEINGGENYITELKRRRTEEELILEDTGPTKMQTDGPSQIIQHEQTAVPKNLQVAGSGHQARLAL